MAKVEATVHVEASLAETWEHYFREAGWPAWVEGFGSVSAANGYPDEGGTLSWRSSSAGRGTVQERVLEHEPRRVHRIAFTDPATEGELRTSFAIKGEGTEVAAKLEYRLLGRGAFDRIAGLFFVKGQIKGSLERSLEAFKHEAEERARVSSV